MVLRLQNREGKQKRKKALQGGWYPGEERLGGTTYWKPEPLLCGASHKSHKPGRYGALVLGLSVLFDLQGELLGQQKQNSPNIPTGMGTK